MNSLAGFALTRLNFRGRTCFSQASSPLSRALRDVRHSDGLVGVQLPTLGIYSDGFALELRLAEPLRGPDHPAIVNAFSIFLFAQFFQAIPKELDEAAMVDGAGWFRIYRSVVAPLAGPAFATSAILTFLAQWNSYLWPLLVIQREELRPVQIGLKYFFPPAPPKARHTARSWPSPPSPRSR